MNRGQVKVGTPRRNCLIRVWLEREPLALQQKMEERAATCLRRVLDAKPASRPSWRNSSTCSVEANVETMDRLSHQTANDFQVESYIRIVEGWRAAWMVVMTLDGRRLSLSRHHSISRWLAATSRCLDAEETLVEG